MSEKVSDILSELTLPKKFRRLQNIIKNNLLGVFALTPDWHRPIANLRRKRIQRSITPKYDYSLDQNRVYEYLTRNRPDEKYAAPDLWIPIGKTESMNYKGKEPGGHNDRTIYDYLHTLFRDNFASEEVKQAISQYREKHNLLRGDIPLPALSENILACQNNEHAIFGGYDEAFAPGKVVLDLGSGQALAIMQLAQLHPNTTFIGIDKLYQQEIKIEPKQIGLQLTQDNWEYLDMIPDNSIDTVLSLQSLSQWGFPSFGCRSIEPLNEKVARRIIRTLTRVVKVGGTVRFDTYTDPRLSDYLSARMDKKMWQIYPYEGRFIAKKMG